MNNAPRQDRAVRTREQILGAAVDVLVDHGYAGFTMQRVQTTAGVSRGALTHHFGSMPVLAAAAIDFIAENQAAEIAAAVSRDHSVDAAVDVVLETIRRPTYIAGLQLWVAARTEPLLRDALSPGAHRLAADIRDGLAPILGDLPPDRFALLVDGLLSLLRGLAIGGVLRDRPDHEKAVVLAWLSAFDSDHR